jgi:hypothetical protein
LFHILLINCLRLLLFVYLYWILEKSHTFTRVTLLSTSSTFILSWTDMTFEWSFMLCLVPIKFYFWTMPQITRSYNDNRTILCIRSSLLWVISDVKFISSKVRIVSTFSVNQHINRKMLFLIYVMFYMNKLNMVLPQTSVGSTNWRVQSISQI